MVHEVKFNIGTASGLSIESGDIEFKVKKDGEVLGTLKVSKGTLDWLPKNKAVNHRSVSWEKFDEIMRDSAKEKKK